MAHAAQPKESTVPVPLGTLYQAKFSNPLGCKHSRKLAFAAPASLLHPTPGDTGSPNKVTSHLGATSMCILSCPAFPSYSCVLSFWSLPLTATALETSQGSHV